MKRKYFKGKKITVMGVGLHGGALAMIKWLVRNGAEVIATDTKKESELEKSVEILKSMQNVKLVLGGHREEDFTSVDMVIKNPTVPWTNKFVQLAIKNEIPVEMDSSLFFQLCLSKNIIGVTGTKGKTTSSLLIYSILKKAGKDVYQVGIGQEAVMDKLDKINKDSWVVFEFSSWRLSALEKIKKAPRFALISNLYPDHLNHYGSYEEYINDKKNIYRFQKKHDFMVINWDDRDSRNFESEVKSQKMFFAFSPVKGADCVFIENEAINFSFKGRTGEIVKISEIKLCGEHNLANIMDAAAIGLVVGVSVNDIRSALKSFKGAPHRLEKVAKIDDIDFYNDTAATTPDAAIAGVDSFSRPITLICGGSDKKLDLDSFAMKIAKSPYISGIFLLKGDATEKLKKGIIKYGGELRIINEYDNIITATKQAKIFSTEGSVILLSPGCASFGMFKNEFDRGDKFIEAVNLLKK